jgi:hypothetical protein
MQNFGLAFIFTKRFESFEFFNITSSRISIDHKPPVDGACTGTHRADSHHILHANE